MAREVLPVVKHTPVLAGVNGTDPFMIRDAVPATSWRELGFSGVQNFPTVGLIDGVFRANLEETGMGYGLEVDMIRDAHDLDLLTTPYVFDEDEREGHGEGRRRYRRLPHGPHDGRRHRRRYSPHAGTIASPRIDASAAAAKRVRDDVIVLCHGGPIAEPADAEYILTRCRDVHGFYGASSMERLPTEKALTEQTRKFKQIEITRKTPARRTP